MSGSSMQGIGCSSKHFVANNQETDRFRVSAIVGEGTLREVYLPAFERIVKQHRPFTVMSENGPYVEPRGTAR